MYEGIIQDLIDELGRLPGVGPKSAQRIAFHIIASDRVDVTRLAEVLKTVKNELSSAPLAAISQRRIYAKYAGIQEEITPRFV